MVNTFKSNKEREIAYTRRIWTGLSALFQSEGRTVTWFGKKDSQNPGQFNEKDKGALFLQETVGDIVVACFGELGYDFTADIKVEDDASRNMFYETDSNHKEDGTGKKGWAVTSRAQYIMYAFADVPAIAVLSLGRMRAWLATMTREEINRRFRWVPQSKHVQRNKTMGNLIPWVQIPEYCWGGCLLIAADGAMTRGTREDFLALVHPAADAVKAEKRRKAALACETVPA